MIKGFMQIRNSAYQEWIDDNIEDDCKGACLPAADAMVKMFPELRVKGIQSIFSGHAWCITEDGYIVDPTAHQFDSVPMWAYEDTQILNREDFPTGKCFVCGEVIWPDTPRNRELYMDEAGPHDECMKRYSQELNEDEEYVSFGEDY